jgi:hypothetical protein
MKMLEMISSRIVSMKEISGGAGEMRQRCGD